MSCMSITVTAAAPHSALADLCPLERQRLFALRFRTEYCRTFMCTGECRYRDKCMFAHGDSEMRTEAQNEADELVSDKAVRIWIRDKRRAAYAAAQAAKAVAAMEESKDSLPTNQHHDDSTSDDSADQDHHHHSRGSDDRSSTADDATVVHHVPHSEASEDSPLGGRSLCDAPMPTLLLGNGQTPSPRTTPLQTHTQSVVPQGPVVFKYRYNPYSSIRVKLVRGSSSQ